jgi:hypothetical protein
VRPLRDLRHSEREGREIRARRGHEVGLLRDHALGRVLGLLGGVAAIEHDELQLRAAERLDAALGVDVVDADLGAHAHHGPGPRVQARERDEQADLDLSGLLRPGRAGKRQRGRGRDHGPPCRKAFLVRHLRPPLRRLAALLVPYIPR